MTAFLAALASLVTAFALLLFAIFLLRMAKPLSTAIVSAAETQKGKALRSSALRHVKDQARRLVEGSASQ